MFITGEQVVLLYIVLTQRPESIKNAVGHQGEREGELGNHVSILKCQVQVTYVTSIHLLFGKICHMATSNIEE